MFVTLFQKSMTLFNSFNNSDFCKMLYKMIRINVYNIKYEPDNLKQWVSIVWYNKKDDSYCEKTDASILAIDWYKVQSECKDRFLFCYRNTDEYTYRMINSTTDMIIFNTFQMINQPNLLSNIRFIMIEYTHPGLKESIVINLNSDYYFVGNEILSDIFIERYLSYNYGNSCIFDKRYSLSILDNNFDLININQSNYIELKAVSYDINCKY